jgi:transcription initiation factor TFIIIB Brf1 subunit/transcription initiation factor TFIIB
VHEEEQYVMDFNGSRRTPYLPAGGLSLDHRSFKYKYRQRIYSGSNAIKQVKRTLHLPDALCEGAMSRFLKLSQGNNRGTSFAILAGLALLLEAQDWDHPLLKREIIETLELDERKFFKTRRRLRLTLKQYSPVKLAWKYMQEKKIPHETWDDIRKWMARAYSKSNKALAASAVYLATRQLEDRDDLDTISWWFETSKISITRSISELRKRYSL